MGILLVGFAIAIGHATFIENDYGAVSAKFAIYNTLWFEVLLFVMVLNFVGMIFTKKLYKKGKINILIIHLALVVIIIGAGITRYIGFEGQIHIRNQQTTNLYRSTDTYLQIQFKKEQDIYNTDEKIFLAPIDRTLFSKAYNWKGTPIEVTLDKFYPNAKQQLVKTTTGRTFITIVAGTKDGRHELLLAEGESKILHNVGISFGDTSYHEYIQIIQDSGKLLIKFPQPMHVKASNNNSAYVIEGFNPLNLMSVHRIGDISFVVKEITQNGQFQYIKNEDKSAEGVAVLKMKINNEDVYLPNGQEQTIMIDNVVVSVKAAFKSLELPFYLKLNSFDLERYPGSNSPSSFASNVTLIDKENGIEEPHRIFMNNILSYKGYRFYQSSYDQDEQGTILSVNHDYWGTVVTYFGYFLLFGSLIASFFTKKTRFRRITQQINEIHHMRKTTLTALVIVFLFSMLPAVAQNVSDNEIAIAHAEKFGKLLVQNKEGRIEPINTAASKLLLKIHKKTSYNNSTAEQVFVGMVTDYDKWRSEPIIKVNNPEVGNIIGTLGKYAAFNDFINEQGQYKLKALIEKVYMKTPADRNKFDKALMNIDERVNVCYMTLNGSYLSIFPIANDANNKWVTPAEFHNLMGHGTTEGDFFENYQNHLKGAMQSGDYSKADAALEVISNYQKKAGKAIIPSSFKIKAEVFYNNAGLFQKLFPVYLITGLIMVVLFLWQAFNPANEFKWVNKVVVGIIAVAFLVQTTGLILRWYIAGHAPWSNGYESMIYIAWAAILAGFIFMKKSRVTLGVSAVLAGITLLTAHLSWMNPEITNLVPVLKSYWLTIHVATITASYGFLALGCMLGFLNLCILIFRNSLNFNRINLMLKELTLIVEMTLIVGLVFLVIGNFLGGIWANESWGRYWGWDPKETWTLVTVIIYSFTLHTTLIPNFKNTFTFNFLALISFGTVLMTYFGVNYYLSGLHSYANGDPVPVPTFVYYTLFVIAVVSILSAYKEFTFKKIADIKEVG